MKVVVLYRPRSEHGRLVETFIRDFKEQHEADRMDIVDVDSREGIALASLYDIVQYPAIIAMREDGTELHTWQGDDLPLMDEIAYYTYA